jgi:hypothetical protein
LTGDDIPGILMNLYRLIFICSLAVACSQPPKTREEIVSHALDKMNAEINEYAECVVKTPAVCTGRYDYLTRRKKVFEELINRIFDADTFKTQNRNYKYKLNVIWNAALLARSAEKPAK